VLPQVVQQQIGNGRSGLAVREMTDAVEHH
jgi:hypothetical protein